MSPHHLLLTSLRQTDQHKLASDKIRINRGRAQSRLAFDSFKMNNYLLHKKVVVKKSYDLVVSLGKRGAPRFSKSRGNNALRLTISSTPFSSFCNPISDIFHIFHSTSRRENSTDLQKTFVPRRKNLAEIVWGKDLSQSAVKKGSPTSTMHGPHPWPATGGTKHSIENEDKRGNTAAINDYIADNTIQIQ